jgi:sulfate adenylyltransferase
MIKPHGAAALKPLFVDDPVRHRELRAEAETLPSLLLNSAAAANAVMLGAGYFTPLDGFMDVAEAMSVARDMRTSNGLFWPIPVLNLTHDISGIAGAGRIALRDPNIDGNPVLAVMDVTSVESFSAEQIEIVISEVYGTADEGHPGVTVFRNLGSYCIAGKIEVLNFSYFGEEFTDTFRTAVQIREEIRNREWHKVVAFQTRNPMHLAHEELCRIAQERTGADGIVAGSSRETSRRPSATIASARWLMCIFRRIPYWLAATVSTCFMRARVKHYYTPYFARTWEQRI